MSDIICPNTDCKKSVPLKGNQILSQYACPHCGRKFSYQDIKNS